MRAVVCERYGGPEVATITDVARPEAGPGDVLIRTVAGSVNRTDCGVRAASPPIARLFHGLRGPRHAILGCEFAGIVEAVGADVERFVVGDRVFGFDDGRLGGHAAYVAKPESAMIALVPDGFTLQEAGVAIEGAHYAGSSLRAAAVGPGSNVLVYGASGAIGTAAVQLARHLGATVTAVCGTDTVDVVAGLGPTRVVDYQRDDFTAIDDRFDLVFDAVGKTTFGACRPLLQSDGTFIATDFGPRFQNPVLALVTRFRSGPRVRFPIPVTGHRSMAFILDAMAAGAYRPVIDREYRLDDIVEAYRYVESGRKVGTVALAIAPDDDPDDG